MRCAKQIIEAELARGIPPGNWYMLAEGHHSTSGMHSFRDGDDEVPANDVGNADWSGSDTGYGYWYAFPGENETGKNSGDGADCDPELRDKIETIYQGHRCAHVFQLNSASSYHYQAGSFAIVIDLASDAVRALEDLHFELHDADDPRIAGWGTPSKFTGFTGYGSGGKHEFDEFMYPGWQGLIKIAESRAELDGLAVRKHRAQAQPGETSADYWQRHIRMAQAPSWTKQRDGD